MMRIDLRRLAQGHTPFKFEESAAALELEKFFRPRGPVRVEIDADHRGEQVTLQGEVRVEVEDVCGRCTRDFVHELTAELLFFSDLRGKDDPEDEAALEEEGSILYHDGTELILDEAVREALILEVPVVSLCTAECRGLCPRCGQDLNKDECKCPPSRRDARWSVLGNLSQVDDEGGTRDD